MPSFSTQPLTASSIRLREKVRQPARHHLLADEPLLLLQQFARSINRIVGLHLGWFTHDLATCNFSVLQQLPWHSAEASLHVHTQRSSDTHC
jgi:hypothetical protein